MSACRKRFARSFFGPIAIFRGEFATEDEPENEEAVEKADDAGGEANAAAVVGFAIEIRRGGCRK